MILLFQIPFVIKDTSNARPSLKLGGTTLNWSGRWGGGEGGAKDVYFMGQMYY